jgi:hypothetical protein
MSVWAHRPAGCQLSDSRGVISATPTHVRHSKRAHKRATAPDAVGCPRRFSGGVAVIAANIGRAITSTTPGRLAHHGYCVELLVERLKVIVGEDGILTVPAVELARHGVGSGAHLWIMPEQRGGERRSMLGALKEAVPPEAVEDLLRGLDAAKAERIADYTEQS